MSAYDDGRVSVHLGDCLDVLRSLPDASVDAVVTDPPYNLGFMGKAWDSFGGSARGMSDETRQAQRDSDEWWAKNYGGYLSGVPAKPRPGEALAFQRWCEAWATECLRVLKPGGHMLAFGGTRTWHRLACAVEDAGFEVRDSIAWLYGSGFPKSLDVSKAIDRAAGATPIDTGVPSARHNSTRAGSGHTIGYQVGVPTITVPATPDAITWQGWGTALKPAHEPVVCARKPLSPVPLSEEVDRLHHLIGGLLWLSLSPAKRAELTSPSSPAGQREATCVSALVSAALDTSPDASDETATFSSPALASTSSSIAGSWSATLGALSARTRTSTTSTASSTTTALRTLNSLLGPITSQTTMPRCGCLVDGPSSPAPSAASSSSGEWAKWLHTLSASVPATATEGIALAVAAALASIAADLSGDQAAASSADPTATTEAAARDSAFEPVVVARKPLSGTVAANVLAHGTGALNVDACRVAHDEPAGRPSTGMHGKRAGIMGETVERYRETTAASTAGRWPTNVVLDDSQAAALDEMSGESRSGLRAATTTDHTRDDSYTPDRGNGQERGHTDSGGASRFFPTFRYVAKAPKRERPTYYRPTCECEDSSREWSETSSCGECGAPARRESHATVKPLDLMRWLVRLVTPPGGIVLEPFAGSGTTVEACIVEGFRCIAIEREADYLPLILQRIHRRRDPVAAIRQTGDDLGLFELDGESA